MRQAGFLFFVFTITNPFVVSGLEICVENPARLDPPTVQAFRTELSAILAASGRDAAVIPCRPGIMTITLRPEPPREESSALGGIRYRSGRLEPEIELFVSPTAQIVRSRLPGVLGRALARVATHEFGHWLNQSPAHAAHGVMMERLSAAHLTASNRAFFRLPPGP